MNFTARLTELQAAAVAASSSHRETIEQALSVIEAEMQALRNLGLTAEMNWPYGRGEVAKATSARLTIGLSVTL